MPRITKSERIPPPTDGRIHVSRLAVRKAAFSAVSCENTPSTASRACASPHSQKPGTVLSSGAAAMIVAQRYPANANDVGPSAPTQRLKAARRHSSARHSLLRVV